MGNIFRPPSEADSLLLQVTVGCSHNRCTFCGMYAAPEQRFRPKAWDLIAADIAEAAAWSRTHHPLQRVFLCDGDALILPTAQLARILSQLRREIPSVRRVGIYGDARSILRKSRQELSELRELGLGLVYHGVESGDAQVLERVCKGSTAEQAAEAGDRLRNAGIRHSVMVMLGLGGAERSTEHARATAGLLTRLDPPFVGALTTTVVPGTVLEGEQLAGRFRLPDPWGLLTELRILIAESRFSRCRFHSNHASNYLPLSLNLPADRDRGLAALDAVLARRDGRALRPEHRRGL